MGIETRNEKQVSLCEIPHISCYVHGIFVGKGRASSENGRDLSISHHSGQVGTDWESLIFRSLW